MAAKQKQVSRSDVDSCSLCLFCCVFLGGITTIVTLIVLTCMSKDPVYSVTITGVAGLDPTSSLSSSPVFNVTVRIDNTGDWLSTPACIGRLSTVSVSYNDALLGRGSVAEFCAEGRKVEERRARAWGQHVNLPQFLRDQLAGELTAGEAAVDVKVTTPAENYRLGDTVFVCRQAKIGGGPARCRKERVVHDQQANPGSTGGSWPVPNSISYV